MRYSLQIILSASLSVIGCSETTFKLYDGPPLPRSELSLLEISAFAQKVDERPVWSKPIWGSTLELLPGFHTITWIGCIHEESSENGKFIRRAHCSNGTFCFEVAAGREYVHRIGNSASQMKPVAGIFEVESNVLVAGQERLGDHGTKVRVCNCELRTCTLTYTCGNSITLPDDHLQVGPLDRHFPDCKPS